MIRRTSTTFVKKIWQSADHMYKREVLYRRTTFWFIIIPIYSYTECIG